MEAAKMSPRGQIVIPKRLREKVEAVDSATFLIDAIDERTLILRRVDTAEMKRWFEELRERTGNLSMEEIVDEVRAVRKELAEERRE